MGDYSAFLRDRTRWSGKGNGGICGWASLVVGAILAVLVLCYPKWTREHISDTMNIVLLGLVPLLAGASVFILRWVYSSYAVFKAEKDKVIALKERMKPRLRISGGKMEKSFMVNNETFYFRPILELDGVEPLYNVEARITQIREDGKILELDEQPLLAMHPAASPTLPALTPNTLGFVDLIRADSNKRPELALVYPYVTIKRGLVGSGHTYEIDIRISYLTAPNNAVSQDCTARFRWERNPSASLFEILTQPASVPNTGASPPAGRSRESITVS